MKKGGPLPDRPLFSTRRRKKPLTLRELEAAAGLRLAVFLALDRAAVAGQEAGRLDRAAQRGLEAGQRLRDAVQHRNRLARQAAALYGRDNVVAADPVGQAEIGRAGGGERGGSYGLSQ